MRLGGLTDDLSMLGLTDACQRHAVGLTEACSKRGGGLSDA